MERPQFYYQNSPSTIENFRPLLIFYGGNNRRSILVFRSIVENFKPIFSLHNVKVPVRQETA